MVDFKKALEEHHQLKDSGEQFVGYCRICDILSKIYESNIIRLHDDELKDLFKCPRCKVFQERDEMIPF